MTTEEQALVEQIKGARRYGFTFVGFSPRSRFIDADVMQNVNQFVGECGFHQLEENWNEIESNEARVNLIKMLSFDLAYGGENMDWKLAQSLTGRFLDMFSDDVRLFTNCEPEVVYDDGSSSRAWTPLSDATFDEGVVAVDACRIGLVVVIDED